MIRRKHILALTVTLMLLPLLTTCSMEERLRPVTGDGVPASVTLSFGVNGHTVYTRASQSEEDENRVDNLYILMFRKDNGELVTTANDEGERLNFFTTSPQDDFSGLSYNAENQEGSVRFTADYSGDVIIVGVANIKEGDVDTGYDLTKADLDSFEGTLDEFKEYVVRRNVPENQSPVSRGSHFLMTGSVETTIGTTADYDVLEDELVLERVDAKVTVSLSVDIANGDGISYENVHFEPKTWKVMRLPQQSLLLPYTGTGEGPWEDEKSWDAETGATKDSPAPASYTDTDEYEIEVSSSHLDDQTMLSDGGSFTFYMPENRKKFKESASSYTHRETIGTDGSFTYANPNSTYIVVNGNLSFIATEKTDSGTETDSDTETYVVDAFVTFTLHLGLGASADGNHNNYDTRRNSDYTYNIKVTGIKSITTDVTVGRRPGYEGDIIYNTTANEQKLFTLDAHYETRLISIPKTSDFSKMTWSVITPFASGVYVEGGDNSSLTDYEWIKFAVNAHYTDWNSNVTDGKTFAKFPGTTSEGILHYNNSEARTSEVIDDMGFLSMGHPLMNVDQLIKYLQWRSSAENGGIDELASSDGNIYITAFIDEYYYPDKDWKEFVNTFDRRMHIIYDKSDNYAFYEAGYSFVQRSIRSIYNTNADEKLHTAWGVETITEPVGKDQWGQDITLLLPGVDYISVLGENSDRKNGKANTETLWSGNYLPNIIEYRTNTLNDSYRYAVYACMLRNRDEDGNDRIDSDELKWYLAAIDQLVDLYIGEWALNQASRLYPYDPAAGDYPPSNPPSNVYWHYTSSSANAGENYHPWVLWAEEGASIGSYDKPDDDSDSKRFVNDRYSYRCLRNLGEGEPQDFVQIDGSTINLSWLNPDARREESDNTNALDAHNQKSEVNRPFEKFIVGEVAPEPEYDVKNGSNNVSPIYTSSEKEVALVWSNLQSWNEVDGKDENPCPRGFRAPNQRELLIMVTRYEDWPTYSEDVFWYEYQWFHPLTPARYEKTLTEEPPFYLSQTAFSLNGKPPYNNSREGFIYSTTGDIFQLQNNTGEKGYVRCIRDIK